MCSLFLVFIQNCKQHPAYQIDRKNNHAKWGKRKHLTLKIVANYYEKIKPNGNNLTSLLAFAYVYNSILLHFTTEIQGKFHFFPLG